MPELIGQTLGKYRIVARLGRGGMAEVYKAYQPGLDRYVAIKVLHSHLASDPDFIGRFEREARAVANLRHPNIVQVFDFDVENEMYYMAMEFVDGPTLKAELLVRSQQRELFSLDETTRIMVALCSAIDYAHSHGMVHRDLKPANFILTKDGQILILDFGIAKIVGATQFTVTGAMSGTPAYMSPEQGQGERGDERSDIYSLGVVLYEMVTGRIPFDADTPFAIIMKHITTPLPLPRSVNPNIPEPLERVILKALSKDPADRFQSGADFAATLREAVGMSPYDTLQKNPITTITPITAIPELQPGDPTFKRILQTPAATISPQTIPSQPGQPADAKTQTATVVTIPHPSKRLMVAGLGIVAILMIIGILLIGGRARTIKTQVTTTAIAQIIAQTVAAAEHKDEPHEQQPQPPIDRPTDTATITSTPTPTPTPSSTPDLDATIAARLTATSVSGAVATVAVMGTQAASVPTNTLTPIPTDTPVPTNTPPPTDTPAATDTPPPQLPTPTPTLTPEPATPTAAAPRLSGRIAVPIDNAAGRYDVIIYSVADGSQMGKILGARQPYYRSDGMLLVNGEPGPQGGGAGDNIYMYNADGSGGQPLSASPNDGYPTWSPDGGRIAYDNPQLVLAKTGGPMEWHVFVQDSLTIPDTDAIASFGVLAGDIFDSGQPLYPIWVNDDAIVFRACDFWPGGRGGSRCAIWRTPSWATVGGTGYQVPALAADLNGIPTDAEGSILLAMSQNSGNWDVYRGGIAGGPVTNLTSNASQDGLGTISPDGQWLAFVSDRSGQWEIWGMPVTGGDAAKLFDLPPHPWGTGGRDWTRERISWGQ